MPLIGADTEAISGLGTRILGSSEACKAEISNLQGLVATLVGTPEWMGPAAEAFRGNYDQWNATAVQMLAGLEQISQAVQSSSQSYAQTDAGIARHIPGVDA